VIRKNNTLIYGVIGLAVLIIAVIGIGFYGGNTGTPEMEKVTVMMPYVESSLWMPFYCAIDQGYYADEGLDVEMTYSPKGSMGPIEQVSANNIQLGYASGCSIITAKSKGLPIVAVYQIEHTNQFSILTKKDSGITKPKDLVGKSIAVAGIGSPPHLSAKAILFKSGVDVDSVTFVPVGAGSIPVLLENKTDAIGASIIQENILNSMNVETNIMYAKDYNANLASNAIITNEITLKNNPELIKKFVRATNKGLRYAIDNPEKVIDIYIKFNPDAAKNRDFSSVSWTQVAKESIQPDKYPLGSFNKKQWEGTQDVLYEMKIINKKTPISEMYTDEFVPK